MQTIGMYRNVDSLGRIVIPMEIRKSLNIKTGDPLEIYSDNKGRIIFKKNSPLELYAKTIVDGLAETVKNDVIIVDGYKIIAVSNGLESDLDGHSITNELHAAINKISIADSRKQNRNYIKIIDNELLQYKDQLIRPVSVKGNVIGAIIILTKEWINISKYEDILNLSCSFITKQYYN